MTVGDTLDGAFQVLRTAWPIGLVAVLLLQLLHEVLQWGLLATLFPRLGFLQPGSEVAPSPDQLVRLGGEVTAAILLITLLSALLTLAASLVVLVAVAERDRGGRPRLGAILVAGLRRAPGLVVASLALVAAVGVATVLAVVLAGLLGEVVMVVAAVVVVLPLLLALSAVLLILPAATVLEGRSAWSALGRAVSVVRRRLGRAIGVTLLIFLLLVVIGIGVGLLNLPFAAFGEGALVVGSILLNAVSGIVFVGVTAGAGAMLLLDASARLEGADLAARARGFGPGNGGW